MLRIKGLLILLLLSFSFLASSQKIYIPVFENNANANYFNHEIDSKKILFDHQDTATLIIRIPESSESLMLYPGNAEINILTSDQDTFYSGKYINTKKLIRKGDLLHIAIPKSLNNKELQLKSYNLSNRPFFLSPHLLTEQQLLNTNLQSILKSKRGILITSIYIGGLLIFFIYIAGLYIQNRMNKDFLFYAIYILTNIIHSAIQTDAMMRIWAFFPENPIVYHQINEITQVISYPAFMLFVIHFLNLKELSPKAYLLSKINIWVCSISAVLFFTSGFVFKTLLYTEHYLSFLWIIISILSLFTLYYIIRDVHSKLTIYIVIGSILLIVGAFTELAVSLTLPNAYNWSIYSVTNQGLFPFNFSQIAILLEVIFFAFGIGYKIKLKDQELLNYQISEVELLKQESLKKETEIQNLSSDLAQQKEQVFQQNELLKDLGSQFGNIGNQLNPEFILSNLATIGHLLQQSMPIDAKDYLKKFSRLVQNISNKTMETLVPLEEELNTIKLYLDLEKLRLHDKFYSKVVIENQKDMEQVKLPPFVIQEYLEFCIWNQIIPSKKINKIIISFEVIGNVLSIQIIDNGIRISPSTNDKLAKILQKMELRIKSSYQETPYEKTIYHKNGKHAEVNELTVLVPASELEQA